MAYNYEYPGTNLQDLNGDWLLQFVHDAKIEWEKMKAEWEKMQGDFSKLEQNFITLEQYVKNEIEKLPDYIKQQITILVEDGTIEELIRPILQELELKVQTNTTNISNLTVKVNKNESDISDLETRVSRNETNISANTTNISANSNRINTNTQNIAANTAEIEKLKGQVPSGYEELVQQVNQNKTDITVNASNIAKNVTDIGNLKLNDQSQDSKITSLQTEQTEMMQDIADINQLDITQNNRLTALENRPVSGGEYIWLIIDSRLSNIIADFKTTSLSTSNYNITSAQHSIDSWVNAITQKTIKPSKPPTRIIFIPCAQSFNSSEIYVDLQKISTALTETYPLVQCYWVYSARSNGREIFKSINKAITDCRYSVVNKNPFFHQIFEGVFITFADGLYDNNGDFTAVGQTYTMSYWRNVFINIFGGTPETWFYDYEIPITLNDEYNTATDANEAWIHFHYSTRGIEIKVKIVCCGFSNDNFSIGGAGSKTAIATIPDTASNVKAFPSANMSIGCQIGLFSRDNRVAQVSKAGIITFTEGLTNFYTVYLNVTDISASELINGFQVETTTFRDW